MADQRVRANYVRLLLWFMAACKGLQNSGVLDPRSLIHHNSNSPITMSGSRWGRAINKYIEQGAFGVALGIMPIMPASPVIDLNPATRQTLFTFATQADLDQWEVFTDRTLGIGGTSTAELARCPDTEVACTLHAAPTSTRHTQQEAARFSGVLSREQGAHTHRKAVRTGICGMRTKVCRRAVVRDASQCNPVETGHAGRHV